MIAKQGDFGQLQKYNQWDLGLKYFSTKNGILIKINTFARNFWY
jgi:hypothetical protein